MKIRMLTALFSALLFFSCADKKEHSLPFIMDMVHKNPGEAHQPTKYTNPTYLKEAGYNAMVPQWHVQCGLTYDSYEKGLVPEGSQEREWILKKQHEIKEKLKEAKSAGLQVYPFTDMFVMPTLILEKYQNEIVREEDLNKGANALHGKLIPDIKKDLTVTLIKAQIKELFETFPEIDGLVIRFGETYLFDTPFHGGGNPVRGWGQEGIDGHVKLIKLLRDEICKKYNKKLFYRTWDFGFFHTNADIYKKITDGVEPHANLIFSIKYTRGDFHRLTQFNPTLGIGNHPYIVEFQGQPEYYGKGAHPVYVFGGVLNGFSEYSQNMKPNQLQSISALKGDPKFQGMWTWSRGGGWRGPYIQHELWCDINTHAAAIWAQDTTQTESVVLDKTLVRLGVKDNSLKDFKKLIAMADEAVLKGQCSEIDVAKSGFNVWWSRDQYFSGEGSLNNFFSYIVKNNKGAEMLTEKDHAVALWHQMEKLTGVIEMEDSEAKAYLAISTTYGRIKHDLIRQMFRIMYYGKEFDIERRFDKENMRNAIEQYDLLWEEWKLLKANNPLCATIYEPNAFQLTITEGVKGNENGGFVQTVDKYRVLVK